MAQADERELLQRAKLGEGAALAALVRRHQTAVFNVAYRLLGNRQDAEDAAQEAFVRAFRALGGFDTDRPFAPWVKRITVNHCLNQLEKARIRPAVSEVDLAAPGQAAAALDHWAQPKPTPEQMLMAKERTTSLWAAILQLPPPFRAVIELRHFQGMRYDEIAAAMDRPLSSVKSDLFRARKMLAEKLKEK